MSIPPAVERRNAVLWWIAAFVFLVYFAGLTWWINRHRMFWVDEILGWYFYTDPSWERVMRGWNAGREGSGVLFNLMARRLVRFFGADHLNTLRYYSSFCIAGAFLVWTKLLRRVFGSWSVVISAGIVWLTNYDLLFHVGESRFYGQYILGSVLVIWSAVRAETGDQPPWIAFLGSMIGGVLLAGSQVLGVFWVFSVLVGQLLTRRYSQAKLLSMAGFALSSVQIVLYRSLFTTSRQISNWWIQKPTLGSLTREYAGFSLQGHLVAVAMFLSVTFGLLQLRSRLRQGQAVVPEKRLLLVLLVLFASAPIAFFVISRNLQSIFLARYMLPTLIAFSGLVAWGVSEMCLSLQLRLALTLRHAAFVAALVCLVCLHLQAMRNLAISYDSFSKLTGLERLGGDAPVLFEDMVTQEQLHLYRPSVASRFYVTLHANQMHSYMTMDMSYWPYWEEEVSFFQAHPHIIFVDTPWAREMGLTRYLSDPAWTSKRLPDLVVGSATFQTWDLARRTSEAATN